MIKYTGHPFVDAGVAVLENMLDKPCEEFSQQDLSRCEKELRVLYERKAMKGYLAINFPNSGWCNPTIGDDKKEEYIRLVLQSSQAKALKPHRKCAFCGEPAVLLADRRQVPLLTGETILNNAPDGITPGLPVCGTCLYSIQFYPLGTLKVSGKPLFWWSTNTQWMRQLVGNFYFKVRQVLELATDKFPNFDWPRTRLLQTAEETLAEVGDIHEVDVIGYHVTNYGAGPDYDTYEIPEFILDFLKGVKMGELAMRTAHQHVIRISWEKSKKERGDVDPEKIWKTYGRNRYYEALLEVVKDSTRGLGIISNFYIQTKAEFRKFNNFKLCETYLKKVIGVEGERLDLIRDIADRIMNQLVIGNRERKWLDELFQKRFQAGAFLRYLVRVQRRLSQVGASFAYGDALKMLGLETDEDSFSKDLWLVQDLMLIRMLEVGSTAAKELIDDLPESDEEQDQ